MLIKKRFLNKKEISFLSTAFDEESIDFLDDLGIKIFKIPSGEITNKPYLQRIASKGKPVILSTGMSTLKEIEDAISIMYNSGLKSKDLTVLHCNTAYPTPMNDVNLIAMKTIEKHFNVKVGYSDHTLGIEVPIAAVALGATVIEKHFTLNRELPGPDHLASLMPEELKMMIRSVRNVEKAISGSGIKEPTPSELKNIDSVRKSIHIKRDLSIGTSISREDLIMLRPGNGISPMDIDKVIGKKVIKEIKAGDQLKFTVLL
jgi:N-acetylneuraminate synthase/N,N'-diacetyllegionaminate synthase